MDKIGVFSGEFGESGLLGLMGGLWNGGIWCVFVVDLCNFVDFCIICSFLIRNLLYLHLYSMIFLKNC